MQVDMYCHLLPRLQFHVRLELSMTINGHRYVEYSRKGRTVDFFVYAPEGKNIVHPKALQQLRFLFS